MLNRTALHIAVSVAWGLVVALIAYAAMKTTQALGYPDPNPANVLWSAHSGFVWRVWTATYGGGICAFVVGLGMGTRREAAARALAPAVTAAAAVLGVQVALFP